MPPTWEETEEIEDIPSFEETEEILPVEDDQISKMQSAGKGLLQGTTFGFADEIGGLAGAATDKLASLIGGGPSEPFMDSYRRERDKDRASYDAAREANPGSFGAGEFGGAVATALIPGTQASKAAQAMKYAKAAKLAGAGAVQGAGLSEADLLEGDVTGAAKDMAGAAALNVAMPEVIRGAGKVAKAVVSPLAKTGGYLGKRALSATLGPSMEAIETRFADPDFIKNAKPLADIATEAAEGAGRLSNDLSGLDDMAWRTLRTSSDPAEGAIPKHEVVSFLKRLRGRMEVTGGGTVGGADAKANSTITKLIDDIDNLGYKKRGGIPSAMGVESGVPKMDYISESQMKQIVQAADRNIDWEDPAAGKANEALKAFRETVDDRLKKGNKAYAEAMVPVQENTRLLKGTEKSLALRQADGGYAPSDTTMSKLDTILNEKRGFSKETVDKFGKAVGMNISDDVRAARLAKEFAPGGPKGGEVNVFNPQFWAGEQGPVLAGKIIDKTKSIADWAVKNRPEALGKFAQPLIEAAGRGGNQLAVADFVLQQRYPEYNQMLSQIEKEGEQ